MGSYWNTKYATNGVMAQIFALAFEDGSYDAELIHDLLPGSRFEIPDTTCVSRDTVMTIKEGAMKIEQQFADITHAENKNGSASSSHSFSRKQNILVTSRQFRKQTEVL